MNKLNNSIVFPCGLSMKNRFMLAPLTNTQSFEDGKLSDDEFTWLTLRAKGNFGITMSCASHVQEIGKGFPGQLGIFDDKHIDGLKRLTDEIRNRKLSPILRWADKNDQIIITPHIGGMTTNAQEIAYNHSVELLRESLDSI